MKQGVLSFLREEILDRLKGQLSQQGGVARYVSGAFGLTPADYYTIPFDTDVQQIKLRISDGQSPEKDDLDNAILLHEGLKSLSCAQAADQKLWAFLTHHTFLDYTRGRWPVPHESGRPSKTAANFILEHWFLKGERDRALRRNSVARLFWAARVTWAPWETDAYFADLKCADAYRFTRVLLRNQDIYQQVLERGFGRDGRILVTILEMLEARPDVADSRVALRDFLKQINLTCAYRLVGSLSRADMQKTVQGLAVDVQGA